ncbi:methyl-viologen-reducing hydrogenase delta subunit [Thermincola potens JR]|uniref:Methyl-viologen-reducing hydrogenase delta subunit n=2 Tax=Thermincola TaxID=278993 RepID=D5XDF6_THEPJ|nr:methyl-viologen-reducing hydrogenase delta subunit [Thermincola potens JR]
MSVMMENNEFKPKIVGFCCNWCSYAGADLAGISRFKQPPYMRIIRVPCSGRVNPVFVVRAFQRGADGVLVAGCHPGDCHYATGNYFTRRRFLVFKRLLEYVGYEPGRFKARWISGAEGQKFADNTKEMTETIKALGPNLRFKKFKESK